MNTDLHALRSFAAVPRIGLRPTRHRRRSAGRPSALRPQSLCRIRNLGPALACFAGLMLIARAEDKSGVSPTAISLPKGPGSIEGLGESFQPNLNTGTASYGISISLPPGTAGYAPSLALRYEGGSGNGPLGFGWNLPLSYIQRRTDQGIPLYGEHTAQGVGRPDVFINEGKEELVPREDGFYFCKHEKAFVRYRHQNDHWEATLPDGTHLEFGITPGGRIHDSTAPSSRVFSWLLQRATDLRGNAITYDYTTFEGPQNLHQTFLREIRYGPGTPPWDNFHFVLFDYEDRPDWFEDCRAGFPVRTGRRLKAITVGTQGPTLEGHQQGDFNSDGVPDNLNRRYELAYLNYAGADTHWSLLASMQVVGADGSSRLPATTFDYAVCDPPSMLSAIDHAFGGTNEPLAVMDNDAVDLADLNADGLPDVLRTFAGGGPHLAFLNQGLQGADDQQSIAWSDPLEVGGDERAWNVNMASSSEIAHLADMDGDGLADLVFKSSAQQVFFFPNDGRLHWNLREQMAATELVPPTPFGRPEVRTADLDFDKRIDVVQSIDTGSGTAYRIWLNLGDNQYSAPITTSPDSGFDFSQPGVHLVDWNGDRVPDIVRLFPNRLEALAGLGYGRFAAPIAVDLPDEVLTSEQIIRARLTDLTADGLPELVLERAGPGMLWYWVNLGNYRLSTRRVIVDLPTSVGQNAAVRWADVNGNGTTDLLYADSTSEPRLLSVDLGDLIHCGASPNNLRTIANGLGRITQIHYEPSTTFALADAAAGQPWPNPMPFPVQVVAAVTNLDSLGHAYVMRYRYHDGYYDKAEKQFRGFARVEQLEIGDPTAPTLVTRSHFDTGSVHPAMKGRLLRLTVEQEDGRAFTDQNTHWKLPPTVLFTGTNGVEVQFAHSTGTVTLLTELGQGPQRRLESEWELDIYGNQTRQTDYGIVDAGDRRAFADERVTTTEYALDPDRWILRLPMRKETRTLDDVVISRTEYFYDEETFSGRNLGQVGVGNLTLQREWVDPADPGAFIHHARYHYDAYGNAITILDPLAVATEGAVDLAKGHVRSVTYDERFHCYPSSETIHVGDGAAPLIYHAAHDQAFGTLLTATDFNTNTTTFTYDAFARLTSIIRPGDTPSYPTSEYRYGLAVPFGDSGLVNYVETRLLDQPPGSRPNQADHYTLSREFTDGLGRKLMTKREAEPRESLGQPNVVVSSAVRFNARQAVGSLLNPFFSLAGDDLETLLAYEAIEAADWRGLFQEGDHLVALALDEAHQTVSVQDATLREVQSTNPDGTRETTVYAPWSTQSYDANQSDPGSRHFGAFMAHHHDGLGRLIRVDETVRLNDDGTPSFSPSTWTTRYEYDLNDQLTRITDSQGNVKLLSYDGLMRKTWMNDPDRGVLTFRYDDAGNLLETIDAKGQRITYTYDGANRMRTEHFHDPDSPYAEFDPDQPVTAENRPEAVWFYDVPMPDVDQGDGTTLTATQTTGMLSCVWDLTGEEHFSYDSRERATNLVKRILDPVHGRLVSYRTGYAFDSLDRLERVTYPDDDFVRYEYNERCLGRRILGGPTGSIISHIGYSPAGQITVVDYGNGVQARSGYDANLRTSHLQAGHAPSGQEHVAFSYGFDAASNLESITDLRPAPSIPEGDPRRNTQLLEYDDLYRLTGIRYSFGAPAASPGNDGEIRYRYDRIGNLLSQTSDIPHVEQGASLTHLGTMVYGGTAGSAGRFGRGPTDPPGPHALTSIASPESPIADRLYPYDPNGNMLEIDGLRADWDFKDRLVGVENATLRAEYQYDHRDARIIKRVMPKGPTGPDRNAADSTIYVNQYFEVRWNGLATKYVWCGNTRVARATSTLSNPQRLQRLRLRAGWNLCALGVTADHAVEQLSTRGDITAVLRWNPAANQFESLAPADTVEAGGLLWIHALTNLTASVRGHAVRDAAPGTLPAGGAFHPGAAFEFLDPASFAPPHTAIWRFDAATQRWQARLPAALAGGSNLPETLVPGEGLFLNADIETLLALPAEALGIRYYHQDHLGSSAFITAADGRLIEETCFYPFGYPRHKSNSQPLGDPYQFIQRERDRESGFNFLEARYQSPILGRFLRVDPLAGALKSSWLREPQRLNLYAYCVNSPFSFSDPTGTDLIGTVMGAQEALMGFSVGVVEGAIDMAPKSLDPVTSTVSAAVSVYKAVAAKGTQIGDVAYVAIEEKDYKKAAMIALKDERIDKLMDPRTSNFGTGRIIGNETGKALVIIATHEAGGGGGGAKPPTPAPPRPPPPPPARVVVGRGMNTSGQLAKTGPVSSPTIRDPTLPTGPAHSTGLKNIIYKNAGGKAQRLAFELENKSRMTRWSNEFSQRVEAARPEMDRMIQETGSAKPILQRITQEVDRLGIGPID